MSSPPQTSIRISELEGLAAVFRTTAFEIIAEAAQPDPRTFSNANRERNAFLTLYDALSPEFQQQAKLFLLFLRQHQDQPSSDR